MPKINSAINVIIRNRNTILFQDKVNSVTSYNDRGVFDILPGHESFISLIKNIILIHKNISEMQEIKISNGVVRVYRDNVFFYVNFEEQPKKII